MLAPYYRKETHGVSAHDGQVQIPLEDMMAFAHAVQIIAAADGELSQLEMDELVMMMIALGIPADAAGRLREFDPKGKTLEGLIPPRYRTMGRHFIYDAIKVAAVDGYHDDERAAVRRFGKILEVDESVIVAIEGLVEVEAALRSARIRLLRAGH